jgi:hypothetical protein
VDLSGYLLLWLLRGGRTNPLRGRASAVEVEGTGWRLRVH